MTGFAAPGDVRLIVSDVDGTLLDEGKKIAPQTRAAFRRAHGSGLSVALVSSRMPGSLRVVEQELDIPCWKISYDGALIAAPGSEAPTEEVSSGIEWEEALALVGRVSAAYIGIYADDVWICNRKSRWSEREAATTGVSPEAVENLRSAMNALAANAPLHKIMFRDEAAAMARISDLLSASQLLSARWYSNNDTIAEVLPAAANKSKGVHALLERLDVTPFEVLAFGDGQNDLAMFELLPNSIAVGNAIPELKDMARHVTTRGDAHGVADFLDGYFGTSGIQ